MRFFHKVNVILSFTIFDWFATIILHQDHPQLQLLHCHVIMVALLTITQRPYHMDMSVILIALEEAYDMDIHLLILLHILLMPATPTTATW